MSRGAVGRTEGRQLRIVQCVKSELPSAVELYNGRGIRTGVVSLESV